MQPRARWPASTLALTCSLLASAPAHAQDVGIAGTITLQSNQIFRGETISRDSPGANFAVSVDGPLGLFAGADVSVAWEDGAPEMTANSQYLGIAFRHGHTSFELGGVHHRYRAVVDPDYNRDYAEAFVGVSHGKTRLRAYLSHAYTRDHHLSGYVELETRLLSHGPWSLNGHGGLTFIPPNQYGSHGFAQVYEDWNLNVGREWHRFNFAVAVGGTNYPVVSESGRTRVAFSISKSF